VKITFDDHKLKVKGFAPIFWGKLREALKEVADDVLVDAIRERIVANKSVYKGNLVNSIESRLKGIYPFITLEVGSFDVPYALAVEEGTGPRHVSYAAILDWVLHGMAFQGVSANAAPIIASRIVQHIENEGSDPHPFLANTFEARKEVFRDEVLRRTKKKLKG